jgi:hypothetical protein
MAGNAGLKFKNNSLSENNKVFDGNTDQSITLGELAQRRAMEQSQRFQNNSSSVTDSLRELKEENQRILLSKLQGLLNMEYDEDYLEPSQYILKQIAELLYSANNNLGYEMTLPKFLVPDGEGGIRIEWRMNDKYLHLVYSEKRNYLYFQENSEGNGIKDFSANQLIEKLRWLNQK